MVFSFFINFFGQNCELLPMYYIERSFFFMDEKELTSIELTEENIESMIYIIRGQKVMLDFDLARIYGYTTKRLNEQVKRNMDKFPDDFMFKISRLELDNLVRSQIATSRNVGLFDGQEGGARYLPYAFTEQGIYMLMTVLRGELAIKQTIALIRLFKKMKDYIASSDGLLTTNELLGLSRQVNENKEAIVNLREDNKEIKNQLQIVMNNFIDPSTYKNFIILDGERIEADVAYQTIYKLAKHSITIIDDYINIKTLRNLKVCNANIEIIIYSDNVAKDNVVESDLEDFYQDTNIRITIKSTNNKWHDRFIIIDYSKDSETIYTSGSSSKDAGNRITTILETTDKEPYHKMLADLLDDIEIL